MNQLVWDKQLMQHYHAITRDVAWVDVGLRTEVIINGRDGLRVMNNNCTADLRRVIPGHGTEAFVLNIKGTTLGHVGLFVSNNQLELSTVADQAASLISHLRQYIVSEVVDFLDRSADVTTFLVAGPNAAQAMARIGVGDVPEARMSHCRMALDSMELTTRRTDLLGADGFQLVVPNEAKSRIEKLLTSNEILRCSAEVLEAVRLENRIPKYGVDIDAKNLPQEIGRDQQAISFSKGCYLGQETVARLDALGHVNRHWTPIVFSGHDVPAVGFLIEQDGKPVVRVTSAAWSPKFQKPLALGYIRNGFQQPGQTFNSSLGLATVVR